jgi:tetratricopeptide (TPR) repeat protein
MTVRRANVVSVLCVLLGLAMLSAVSGCVISLKDLYPSTPTAKTVDPETGEVAYMPVEGSPLTETELELWNDPTFRKQFVESYLSETEIEPNVTEDERKTMEKVMGLIAKDQMDDAARVLERNRNPAASAVIDYTLANIYMQQERLGKAVALYQTAVDKHKKFRRAWRNLGVIYVRLSKPDKAVEALTKVIELGGGDSITYGLLGFSYSSLENSICAESSYRMAILMDPLTLDWKMGLARSFFRQQRFAEAVSLCGLLIEQYPNKAELWILQAKAYVGMKQPLKAAENYEFVDQLGGSTVETLAMLGDIYINEELFELAMDSYLRAMDREEEIQPDRFVRAAKVLTARGAFEESQTLIGAIDKRFVNKLSVEEQKDILKLRARIAVAEGAGEREAMVLKEIVALDPHDGDALILLGQHSERHEDMETAIYYYERAAMLEEYEADARVRHAQLLVRQRKYDEALPLLRRAQQLRPRDNVQDFLEQVERVAKSR